jgi:O-antigen/teichoic acid export membrane protein
VNAIIKRSFLRNVFTLAGGTTISQGVVVLASPILTRLYTPEVFGSFGVFVSLVMVLACIATLGYEFAIPLPEDENHALAICGLSMGIALLYTLLLSVPIFVFDADIARLTGAPQLERYLWLLPVGVLGIGLYQPLYYLSVRKARYATLSQTRITQSLVMQIMQIAAYAAGLAGLLAGYVTSRYAGISSLLRALPSWRTFRTAITVSALAKQARTHRRFPLWSAPGTLLNTVGVEVPMLAFSALFSSHAAGLYALMHRVLSLPVVLIGAAVADIFFSDAAEAYREGRLGTLVGDMLNQLLWLGLPAAAALMIIGPTLFTVIFGQAWTQAGELAIYASPWLFMALLASPISRVFWVVNQQRELFLLQLLQMTTGVAAIATGIYLQFGFLQTFALFAAAYFLFYLFYLWRSLRVAAVHIASSIAYGLRVGAITILVSVLPYKLLLSLFSLQGYQHQLLAIGLCILLTLLCYIILFVTNRQQMRQREEHHTDPTQKNRKLS